MFRKNTFFWLSGIGLFLLIISLVIFNSPQSEVKNASSPFQVKVIYHEQNAYSYDILANGKLLVRQAFIPGVPGNKKFKTKEEAEKIAQLVVKKLEQKQVPSITKAELDSNGIDY